MIIISLTPEYLCSLLRLRYIHTYKSHYIRHNKMFVPIFALFSETIGLNSIKLSENLQFCLAPVQLR